MKADAAFALEHAGWPALLVDAAGKLWRANPAARNLFGPLLQGDAPALSALWAPNAGARPEQFLLAWEHSPVPMVTLKLRGKDGTTREHLASVCALTLDGQKYFLLQLPAELAPRREEVKNPGSDTAQAQKQKLDCALQLARTVALDFNNALTSILGHTSLVLSKMEPAHPWRASLVEVEKSAARAAEIASDLGAFSRQEKETRAQPAGNLNLLLQRSVEFFQQNAGPARVTWNLQFERKLFTAKFDEAKMQQAFIKILENSIQALREGEGRIIVQTRNIELTQATQDRNVQLAPGAYVCAEISDNGTGIEAEVLPRIFEPFFTTKRTPHRGLGLAWVYGIVTNHGGGVAVSSQPGAGASVRVYLPADKTLVRSNGPASEEDLKGNQTVLMVDDEDLLLTMGQTILSAYGYRVLTANSGPKALELLAKGEPAVDLVITDLVMPVMSGRELVEKIRASAPDMRVLCTSGYVRPAGQESTALYLQKPFTSQELLLKVKAALLSDTGAGNDEKH
jgi:two-component system, cell cycle sensor histidine kinase and response regulator CckA